MKITPLLISLAIGLKACAQSAPPAATPAPAAPAPAAAVTPWQMSPEERQRLQKLSQEDHADMLRQLGITKLRPGRDPSPGSTNPPNTDQALANPFPDYPEALTLKNGEKVTSAEMWWQQRRPEIVEDFEREVVGRVPANVPKVTWEVTQTVQTTVDGLPVVARQLMGHVDNSAYPALSVDI